LKNKRKPPRQNKASEESKDVCAIILEHHPRSLSKGGIKSILLQKSSGELTFTALKIDTKTKLK
jgi:hypothetical protein